MYEHLKDLLAHKFMLDPAMVTPKATFKELGLDSLDVVEFAMLLEKEYGVRVTDDDLHEAGHLDAVVNLLEQRTAAV